MSAVHVQAFSGLRVEFNFQVVYMRNCIDVLELMYIIIITNVDMRLLDTTT